MRTIQTNIFEFDELSEAAKENARSWYREGQTFFWFDDYLASINIFCAEFGVKVTDYALGDGRGCFIDTDATNANFRGLKLADYNKESTPTGFCADSDLRYPFFDTFKTTGDALQAFKDAIESIQHTIRRDIEASNSDEQVDENLSINDYEFTSEGVRA